jgi:hypothetical protein
MGHLFFLGFLLSSDPAQDSLYHAYLLATIIGVIGGWIGIFIVGIQTAQSRKAADAAKEAALAAKNQSEAVINAERAWIMADLGWDLTSLKIAYLNGNEGHAIAVSLALNCRNEGRSIAWITERWVDMRGYDRIPNHPDFSPEERLVDRGVQPLAPNKELPERARVSLSMRGTEADRSRLTIVIYGYVRYRTIFENTLGETRFGYLLTRGGELDRLPAECSEYNRNT